MTINLPNQLTINQYESDGTTDTFAYDYLALLATDIAVYVTLSGQPVDPVADLKVLNVDYVVTGTGVTDGGTIVFFTKPPTGATITITRAMPASIDTNFSQVGQLNGQNLDNAFERTVMIAQQNQTNFNERAIQYKPNENLGVPIFNPEYLYIPPPLNAGDMWMWDGTRWVLLNVDPITPTPEQLALVIDQLRKLIISSGQTFNLINTEQTKLAVSQLVCVGDYYTDLGTENNYIATKASNTGSIPYKLTEGLKVRFRPNNGNTGASTFTFTTILDGETTYAIHRQVDNAQLQPGDLFGADNYFQPEVQLSYVPGQGWFLTQSPGLQPDWTDNNTASPTFIKNKPSIPGGQIQSDWDQTNPAEVDFIKNKPSDPYTPAIFFGNFVTVVDTNVQVMPIAGITNADSVTVWYDGNFRPADAASYYVTAVNTPDAGNVTFFTANSVPAGKQYNYLVVKAPAPPNISFGTFVTTVEANVQVLPIAGITNSDSVLVWYDGNFGPADAALYYVTAVNTPDAGNVTFFTANSVPAGKQYNYLVIKPA